MKKVSWFIIILFIISVIIFSFIKFNKNGKLDSDNLNKQNIIDESNISLDEVIFPDIKKVSDSLNTYYHKKYNFSFDYPSTFKTSNFIEGDGEQIQFQSDSGDWFQIYVTPWDEADIITPERIKKDLPSIVIKEPQQVIIGPKQKDGIGPHALIFYSKDGFTETREIWFVENGYLFQITTYKRLDSVIGSILSTLVFK
jgi:hypothetical protein